jgi:alpha-galactosidase
VEEFNKTYNYCLMPVEGMQSWPQSDRPPLQAPGYVRMPGRPKKERKREPHEKPKAAKISRVGTIIRCRKCKQIGHNRSTCDKRNGPSATSDQTAIAQSTTTPANFSGPAEKEATTLMISTQQSTSASASKKRKATTTSTGTASRILDSTSAKKDVSPNNFHYILKEIDGIY